MTPMSQPHAGIYVRVSTANQIDRDSLITQEERLRAYCVANQIHVYKLYKDAGYSAKDTNRPALKELLHDVEAGLVSSVFVTKLDRITRSTKDLLYLTEFFESTNIRFASISENIDTTSAHGRLLRQLIGVLSQFERELVAERVSVDMSHRAKQGKWNGGVVPFGYTTQELCHKNLVNNGLNSIEAASQSASVYPEQKKLYIEPKEAAIVDCIFNTFLNHNSVRKTAHVLNEQGYRTRNGGHWGTVSIHRILTSPTYIGKTWYGKRKSDPVTGKLISQNKQDWIVCEGQHPSIVEHEIYEKVQLMLKSISTKPTNSKRNYLLSGILKCGLCGGAMAGNTTFKKNSDRTYGYYKCVNRMQKGVGVCKGLNIPSIEIEKYVVDSVLSLSENKEFLSDKQKILDLFLKNTQEGNDTRDISQLEENIQNLQTRLDNLLNALECGRIDGKDFDRRYGALKNEIEEATCARDRLFDLINETNSTKSFLQTSFENLCSFSTNWEFLDDTGKALRLKSIVKEVRVSSQLVEIDIFIDVGEVFHTDRDSWPQPASRRPDRPGTRPPGQWSPGRPPEAGAALQAPIF